MFAAAVVHATLYPWSDWKLRVPGALAWISAGLPRYWTWFDLIANTIAYVVLGFAIAAGWFGQLRRSAAWLATLALCSALSFGLETVQSWLPNRVPSLADWLANTIGAGIGATFGEIVNTAARRRAARGLVIVRNGWLQQGPAAGWVLLLLWLMSQLPPQRLLLASGYVAPQVDALLNAWLGLDLRAAAQGVTADGVLFEAVSVICWIGAIGILAMDLVVHPRQRVALAVAAIASALAIRMVSDPLLLGTSTPLAFLTPGAQGGIVVGIVALYGFATMRRRTRAACAILLIALGVLLVNLAPVGAYFDSMLAAAAPARLANLQSLARFCAQAWPLLALGYFLMRVRRPALAGASPPMGAARSR